MIMDLTERKPQVIILNPTSLEAFGPKTTKRQIIQPVSLADTRTLLDTCVSDNTYLSIMVFYLKRVRDLQYSPSICSTLLRITLSSH